MRPGIYALGLAVAIAGGQDVGSSLSTAVYPVGEGRESTRFAFAVEIPPVRFTPSPAGTVLELEGFERRGARAGLPDIPTRTLRVAIPPGAVPRLEVRSVIETVRTDVRPRPVGRQHLDSTPVADVAEAPGAWPDAGGRMADVTRRTEFTEDGEVYRGDEPFPRRLARLGEIGVLRDQRYVEVHLAPLRLDPESHGLRVATSYEVVVTFTGGEPGVAGASSDPRFESIYRRAFINYSQGRSFRLASGTSSSEGAFASMAGTDGGSPLHRVRVRASGAVRFDYALIAPTAFVSEPLSSWKVTNRGEEVALQVMDDDGDGMVEPTDGNDMLDPGEWVQLWGQALDDEPKAVLNTDMPDGNDIFEARDFSDENHYFLTTEIGARARVAERPSAPTDPPSRIPPSEFVAVARAEVDDGWRPLGGADPWYWLPTLFGPDERTDDVALPGLVGGTQTINVKVHMQGRSESANVDPDHSTRVTLFNSSDVSLAIDNDDGTFDGRTLYLHDFDYVGSQLTDPARIKLEALSPVAPRNDVILDWIEIRYPRSFTALSDALGFEWPDGDAEFVIDGLASPEPEVYEITARIGNSGVVDPVRLTGLEVTGTGPYTVRFRVDDDLSLADGTPRQFVVFGAGATTVPAAPDFTVDVVSDLRDTSIQADIIYIAHPDVLDDPANCASTKLTLLAAHRLAQDSLSSRVVCMEDIRDDFNDGLEGPVAIKNFLSWVMSTEEGEGWQSPKPSFVMLLGDASYVYKDGAAGGNLVPTQIMYRDSPILGYYSSDNVMAAVLGSDQLTDFFIARIPARTVAQLDLVLDKILEYEQSPPPGAWRQHALFIADRGKRGTGGQINAGESGDFELTNADAAGFMNSPPYTDKQLRYWSDFCDTMAPPPQSCNDGLMNTAIKDGVNGDDAFDGAAIVQFTGHGSPEVWSDDAFFDERDPVFLRDTRDLDNADMLSLMMAHNCLTGSYHTTLDHSMGEDWLFREDASGLGGAVAVLAPSGLSFSFVGSNFSDVWWEDVFGPPKERVLGVPVMNGLVMLCGLGSIPDCQNYTLLGDPALNLVMPSVDPASSLQATGLHQQVDLSWAASAAPGATYDIYRTTQPGVLAYEMIATGESGPTYSDMNVTNTVTYFYSVVAVDLSGFESRWSNFNTDCGATGPDCAEATPLNPNPPAAPTGLAVTDPESGGRLDLTWIAIVEDDLDLYEVHYSTEAGCFDNPGCTPVTVATGRNELTALIGLEDGVEYFAVVTATNTSGLRSVASAEHSGTPSFVRGIRSPGFVSDLLIGRSGPDAVLSWGAVILDIYDKAESVDVYEIFRGESSTFVPAPGNKIGETSLTTFTDAGALAPGGPDYHYLVRALDTDGNAGGLGRQLPDGIGDLQVAWGITGNCSVTVAQACTTDPECPGTETCSTSPDFGTVVLSWSAVPGDFDGGPTAIEHYEIYVSDQPFSRSAICDVPGGSCTGMTADQTVTQTTAEVTPEVADQYYTVLAVDTRGNRSPF